MALTASAVDGKLSESLRIVPMVSGRYTTAAKSDLTRNIRMVAGIYLEQPVKRQMNDQAPGMGHTFGTELAVSEPTVSVQTSLLYEADALVLPRNGDHIIRVDVPDFPVLEVIAVETDGALRTRMQVVKVKA